MAVLLLDNLPLPSLKSYTIGSLLLFVVATIYSFKYSTDLSDTDEQSSWQIITSSMAKDPFCTWCTVNMVYCGFFLIGKVIQRIVFGDLRPAELQHIKDKFWNFIFYKFIFIFGVLNVQQMNEVLLWCAWFTIIGFFQLFSQLCCDRFQHLCHTPSTTNLVHAKVIALVGGIICWCCALTGLCFYIGRIKGINVFFFLFCETSLLSLKILHLATKYGIHLWDLRSNGKWKKQSTVTYYSNIGFDITVLIIDIFYHIYMLIYSNIFLSMASLVLCMQLHSLFHDIKHRLATHRKVVRVRKAVELRFKDATPEEFSETPDRCAICWEGMETAKKLKCGHLFHSECLCSWLVHDSSCPTCRHSLEEDMKSPSEQGETLPRRTLLRNHFFHFDGRQIASWFPSFSVEVLHTRVPADQPQMPESRIDAMAHEVQNIFPHIPINIIRADLTRTHSVDVTTDNILEGTINVPGAWEDTSTGEVESPTPVFTPIQATTSTVTATEAQPSDDHQREERVETVSNENIQERVPDERTEPASPSGAAHRGTFGTEFAAQTNERQTSLSHRKQQMLQSARKRYLEKKS